MGRDRRACTHTYGCSPHALSPYSSKGRRDTINTRDGIYNSLTAGEKVALTLVTSPSGSGYAGIINLGVQVG